MKQTDRVPHKARGADEKRAGVPAESAGVPAESAGVPAERAGVPAQSAGITKTSYPLMKYLSLLLAVALLFSGVTFARYLSNDQIDASVGIAAFDATYSIDRVNSTTFGNQDYWIPVGGTMVPQGAGTAISVGMTLKNNGDTSVMPTLHFEGPKEYWDHIALQLTMADENFATGDVLTPQLVIGDITAAADGSFNTELSTDYGSLGGGDAELSLSDSVVDGNDVRAATWKDGDFANKMTITKKTDTIITYSVGFVRESGDTLLPPVFVDCQKKTAVYSIDFQLPALNVDAAEDGEKKPSEQRVIVWLTWTDDAPNMSTAANVTFWGNLAAGASFTIENETITILGYHYDVPGVPVVGENGETTTVRLKKTLKLGEAEGEISYYHVASINDGDGYYPHKAEKVKGNVYECSGPSPVRFDVSGIEEFKEEDVTVIQMNEQKYAPIQQRAFGVSFRATFVQWSEVPAI